MDSSAESDPELHQKIEEIKKNGFPPGVLLSDLSSPLPLSDQARVTLRQLFRLIKKESTLKKMQLGGKMELSLQDVRDHICKTLQEALVLGLERLLVVQKLLVEYEVVSQPK